ncbi:Oidioi.mRNA.OKI2018_I69.XSR.g13369.t1.cds [Oikopleura dioica]|uniref:Oidioi.mRNA.OKI2018_I69.XSR.g13369.t1.cds n=1 Tax=Oikopleura dioica TaxID=34765 RepID=A0ABN7SAI9_OIKDI|nr:Oidioi.mRNA.OKI2018_I69.XSR.g13369.t1.cds [Oikopleura dioica]
MEEKLELTSLVVVGILSASVSFLLFIFCGIMSYKLWWKRNEYRRFVKESNSRADNLTTVFVGWNPIYVPPCSTHRILQMSRDESSDSSQNRHRISDHVVFLQAGQADETCDEFFYRGFG